MATRARQHRRVVEGQRGFTMVELMYAMGYFMVGITGLMCFQTLGASGSARASDISMATNLTSSTIEMVRASAPATVLGSAQPLIATYDRWGSLTNTAAFYTVNPATTGTPTYFTVQATCTPVTGSAYYEIVVNTTWSLPGNPFTHGVSMQTFIPTE